MPPSLCHISQSSTVHWSNFLNVRSSTPTNKPDTVTVTGREKRKEAGDIWCDDVFEINTEAFRDTYEVLKDQHQVITSLFCHFQLLKGVIETWRMLYPLLPFSTCLSDGSGGLSSHRSFRRTPRHPVRAPSTGSSLLIDTSPLVLPESI